MFFPTPARVSALIFSLPIERYPSRAGLHIPALRYFIMNVEAKTRTMNGAKFVMLRQQEVNSLLAEIEFKTGSWQELQADYKAYHGSELGEGGLSGMYVIWINYSGRTVFAQAKRIYEDEDRQNEFMFRIILNALSKMAVTYDLLELYEFARWGAVLREHLVGIGMLKREDD